MDNFSYQNADGTPIFDTDYLYDNDQSVQPYSHQQHSYDSNMQPFPDYHDWPQAEESAEAHANMNSQLQHTSIADVSLQETEQESKEDTIPQQPKQEGRGIAASRAARSRKWPDKSDPPKVITSLAAYKASLSEADRQPMELERGPEGARNLFAIFQDVDDQKRLVCNIKIKGGRTPHTYPGFRDPKVHHLAVGMSLAEICKHLPLHVWGDGLRLFICEGMDAKEIYSLLPEKARNNSQDNRPHNYLQQAMGRQADEMFAEVEGTKRVIKKRKHANTKQEKQEEVVAEHQPQSSPGEARLDSSPVHDPTNQIFQSPSQQELQQRRVNLPQNPGYTQPPMFAPRRQLQQPAVNANQQSAMALQGLETIQNSPAHSSDHQLMSTTLVNEHRNESARLLLILHRQRPIFRNYAHTPIPMADSAVRTSILLTTHKLRPYPLAVSAPRRF